MFSLIGQINLTLFLVYSFLIQKPAKIGNCLSIKLQITSELFTVKVTAQNFNKFLLIQCYIIILL